MTDREKAEPPPAPSLDTCMAVAFRLLFGARDAPRLPPPTPPPPAPEKPPPQSG